MEKNLLQQILEAAGIPYTESYSNEVYMTDPKMETLLGLKRMLSHYGIKSKGVRTEAEHLQELPYPYVLHLKDDFQLIAKPKDLNDEIFKAWDGITLYITDKSQSKEPDYEKHRRQKLLDTLMYGSVLALPIVCVLYIALSIILRPMFLEAGWFGYSAGYVWFALLSTIGLVLGALLLQKQLGENSQVSDHICSLFQKFGCDYVLSSKQAKVGGILSLSEVGLGYFWMQLLLWSLAPATHLSIALIALFGMFFPIWSIYSQWHMHRWCGLCLLTQAVLLLQGVLVIFDGVVNIIDGLNIVHLIITGLALLVGILAAHFISDEITQKREAKQAQMKMRYTMRHPEVFSFFMEGAKHFEYQPEDVTEALGNRDADHHVGLYLSHHCSHCIELQPQVDAFIKNQSDTFAIDIINTDNLKEEEQKAFSERTGLSGTPTIMLDGYQIPTFAELSDLSFMI